MATKFRVCDIPEWSIVRLPDGRQGYLGRSGRHAGVVLVGESGGLVGVDVQRSEYLEVVKYPAQLAQEYIRREAERGQER